MPATAQTPRQAPYLGAPASSVWENSNSHAVPSSVPIGASHLGDRGAFDHYKLLTPQINSAIQPVHQDECSTHNKSPVRQLTITCDAHGGLVTTEPKLSPDLENALANALMTHSKSFMARDHSKEKARNAIRYSNASSTKRKRRSSHSRPVSPDTSGSRSSSTCDVADCSDSSESSRAGHGNKCASFVDVSKPGVVTHLLETLFLTVNQHACRTLAKALIKCIEPDKQAEHPYRREQRAAARARESLSGKYDPPTRTDEWSVWWPDTVTYRGETIAMDFVEPDHLNKERRVGLLVYMLRLPVNCPDYWNEICAKDELFTNTQDCTNWAKWLASKTSQLDLYDKNSRRTKHREFNREAAHSVQEAMGARRTLLDIAFNIIDREESWRRGNLNSEPILKFSVPPIFLDGFLKLEAGNTYHPRNDMHEKNSRTVTNKHSSKKRVLTPPESGDDEPRCGIGRPCRIRDRLSNEVTNMSIQELKRDNQDSDFLNSSFSTQPENRNAANDQMQPSVGLPNGNIILDTSTFLRTQEGSLQSQESAPITGVTFTSDPVLAPSFRYYHNDNEQSAPFHWAQRHASLYAEHQFSPPWSPMPSVAPASMMPADETSQYHCLPEMGFYSSEGFWCN